MERRMLIELWKSLMLWIGRESAARRDQDLMAFKIITQTQGWPVLKKRRT